MRQDDKVNMRRHCAGTFELRQFVTAALLNESEANKMGANRRKGVGTRLVLLLVLSFLQLLLLLVLVVCVCGSQACIATLPFDPSMSALPIIEAQKSQSVGLFTCQ